MAILDTQNPRDGISERPSAAGRKDLHIMNLDEVRSEQTSNPLLSGGNKRALSTYGLEANCHNLRAARAHEGPLSEIFSGKDLEKHVMIKAA